jgi:4-hydroxythreonine-4-phosphate dehydrogenase
MTSSGGTIKPTLAITIGDPAGIGPEVALRAALAERGQSAARLILVGDRPVLADIAARLGLTVRLVDANLEGDSTPQDLPSVEIIDTGVLSSPLPLGKASAEGGTASFRAIERSIELAGAGKVNGVVTAPINKRALSLAGIQFPGHTEIFGEFTAAANYAMLMYSERLAVGLVTCHQSLRSVPETLTAARIETVGRLLVENVERIRGVRPRLAVLGLNPHAGEEGLFGDEEDRLMVPAIAALRAAGIDAEGPLPPDTAFTPRALERYGAHLCLYHDQGLIPFKMISFDDGVNVTMGLPFVRTSVDHGTAYDLAGSGRAEVGSMLEAIELAARLATVPLR